MELEPITRQEQIIAGKDLEPITRMEKFLKEYGGGGGNSDGVSEESQIADLIETDMLPAVHDTDGKILTDENGNVILRY